MESLLPRIDNARLKYDETATDGRQSVALFTGCVTETLDQTTLVAGQRLLTQLGYDVLIPSGQTCCGALYQHEGEPAKSVKLMQQNLRAFDIADTQAVVSMASGCGAQLTEYPKYICGEWAHQFAQRHKDICQFLAEQEWPPHLKLSALKAKVAVHSPCTLSHVLKQAEHPMTLLARIPEIELFDLPDNARCCGAAGSYVLLQPGMADELLADKMAHMERLRPDVVVTSNIGCALHFKSGLRKAGYNIEVMHPVSLLGRQLVQLGALGCVRGASYSQ
jgi:glycolate oxidase iron-sulfur subunit